MLPLLARIAPRLEDWLVRPTALASAIGGLAFAASAAGAVRAGRSSRWWGADTWTWGLSLVALASLGALGKAPVTAGLVLYGVAMVLVALRVPTPRTMIAAAAAALVGVVVRAVASPGATLPYGVVVALMVLAHAYLARATHSLAMLLAEREALLNDRRERPARHRERTSSPGLTLTASSTRTLRSAASEARESEREATASDDAGWEGLVDRIRTSITTLCDDAGVSSTVRAELKGLAPPSTKMRQGVMKVAQEAASHALREAEARSIAVTLRRADGGLVLEVEDDGTVNEGGRSRKALASIRGRVASLGGSAEVKRAAAGWVMRVRLPCEQLN